MNKSLTFSALALLFGLTGCIGDEFKFDEVNTDDLGIAPSIHLALIQAENIELGNFIDLSEIEELQSYTENGVNKWVFVQEDELEDFDFSDIFDDISTEIDNNMVDLSHKYNFSCRNFIIQNLGTINNVTGENYNETEINSMTDGEIEAIWENVKYDDVADKLTSEDQKYVSIPSNENLTLHGINMSMNIAVEWNGFPYAARIDIDIENVTSKTEPEVSIEKEASTNLNQTIELTNNEAVIDPEIMEIEITSTITLLEVPTADFNTDITIGFHDITINNITGIFSKLERDFSENMKFNLGDLGNFVNGTSFLNPEVMLLVDNTTDLTGTADMTIVAAMNDESSKTITLDNPLELVSNENQELSINIDNSNIDNLLNGDALPNSLAISGSTLLGSNGEDVTITPSNTIGVGYKVNIPLYLKMTNVTYSDIKHIQLNLSESDRETLAKASKLRLEINYASYFPVNATIVLELQNENQETFSTIELTNAIEAAEVNAKGMVTNSKESKSTFELTDEDVENIANSAYIKPTVRLDSNNKGIELITTYSLDFSIALSGELAL